MSSPPHSHHPECCKAAGSHRSVSLFAERRVVGIWCRVELKGAKPGPLSYIVGSTMKYVPDQPVPRSHSKQQRAELLGGGWLRHPELNASPGTQAQHASLVVLYELVC